MEKEDQGAKKHTWKMNVTLYSHLVPTKGDKKTLCVLFRILIFYRSEPREGWMVQSKGERGWGQIGGLR